MSFPFKKAAAAVTALVCAWSMCGCMDTGYVGSIDNLQIRNGLYLLYELDAINSAFSKITENKKENGETAEVSNIFVETINGETSVNWIKEETIKNIKRHVAVQRLFEEYGLSLTEEDKNIINEQVNSIWNEDNFYAQYLYGVNTMGEYYTSIGVGRESLTEMYTSDKIEQEVFLHNYGEEGINSVTDEEFDAYIKENYANVKYIKLEFKDKFGINLKEEAEIQTVKDMAKDYADRLNSGESWLDVQYDFDLYTARQKAAADAEDAYDNETADPLPDFDSYIQEAVDKATAEKKETVEQLETIISKASSNLDEGLTEFVWNAKDDGSASLYETDTEIYVVTRDDITTKDAWKTNNKTTVLKAMKNDEFEEMLKTTYADYPVNTNDYLINNKYAPDKIKGNGAE